MDCEAGTRDAATGDLVALDGWLAGHATVWPDRFAELVRDAIGKPYEQLLDEPRKVMTDVQAAFVDQASDG